MHPPVKKGEDVIGFSTKLSLHTLAIKLDSEGRYLIVQGKMFGLVWTLIGVYAPHTGRRVFFEGLIK